MKWAGRGVSSSTIWGFLVLLGWAVALRTTYAQTLVPNLPVQVDDYFGYAVTNLPSHFQDASIVAADNTPVDNPITNAGATLGRVLFYDKRLSHNFGVACASCHTQNTGFSDVRRKSQGVNGQTARHSMALGNAKYYERGKFFWDERADTLEDQVLMPIQDPIEMGMDLATLTTRLSETTFYADLFNAAFGTPDVTSDRISKALAQFVRSMVTYQSKYDSIIDSNGMPDLSQLTQPELRGFQLFHSSSGRCGQCHTTTAQISDTVHNVGLDLVDTDPGAGDGEFKSPSLRNVEVRGRFMHDGRFSTLEEVVEFYNSGIQPNVNLDPVLVGFTGEFSPEDSAGLVAFLKTLTDWNFLNDAKFSNPFVFACDFDANGACGVNDVNTLLAEGPIAGGIAVDPSNARYDLNGDDVLDNADLDIWLTEAALVDGFASPYQRGDANLDGVVDGADFILWNQFKFTSSLAWNQGDFNGDGVVDGVDFIAWNQNKFTSIAQVAVPEPSCWLGWAMLLVAWLRRHVW